MTRCVWCGAQGAWEPEEDARLIDAVHRVRRCRLRAPRLLIHAPACAPPPQLARPGGAVPRWSLVAAYVSGRTSKQVRTCMARARSLTRFCAAVLGALEWVPPTGALIW